MNPLGGLQVHSFVAAQVAQEPDPQRKVGILIGALIQGAAQLQAGGLEKKAAVRAVLKQALFGTVASPDEMRRWLQELTPWEGVKGWAIDKAIGIAPVELVIDRILDLLIETSYQAMRRAGVAL